MDAIDTQLIEAAAKGGKQEMDRLAEMVTPSIKAFLFRVTLNRELAEDLTQETLMQMVSSLGDLRDHSRFRPWIYRIANNKANQYYRKEKKKKSDVSLDQLTENLGSGIAAAEQTVSRELDRKESAKIISDCIAGLTEKYRAVISMRCFEDMPYKHIAESMGCSELNSRVLFVRAKRSLKKKLVRRGIKTVPLVTIITLFGKATVRESMASDVSVVSSSLESSFAAETIATLTSKKTAAVAAAGLVIAAAATMVKMPEDSVLLRDGVNSVHYVMQARNEEQRWGSLTKGAYEKWCYFPEGVDGPMLLRMQRWDTQMKQRLCSWLQNEDASFYYNTGNHTVYVLNERLGGFLEMPTDPPAMAAFITEHQPELTEMENKRCEQSGLLLAKTDHRFEDAQDFETIYEYNNTDPCYFKPFWPKDSKIQDLRTPMHKRGWTYFTVTGKYKDKPVTGKGCIPFVLSAAEKHPAWLRIELADEIIIADTDKKAWVRNIKDKLVAGYKPGTFLKGLARPWLGYNAIDTVRRDAAGQQIPFETFFNEDFTWAQVVLDVSNQDEKIAVVYEIDLLLDLVKSINITRYKNSEKEAVELVFNYIMDVDNLRDNFVRPQAPSEGEYIEYPSERIHWLVEMGSAKLIPEKDKS